MSKFGIIRDPRQLLPAAVLPAYKRCLGLDLGNTTGFAIIDFVPGQPDSRQTILLGQLDLSPGTWDSGALRFIRLKQCLAIVSPDMIAFEEIKNTPPIGTAAGKSGSQAIAALFARTARSTELFGAYMATVQTWCEERGIPAIPLPIGQIKRYATGKGNAGKPDVIRACNAKFGTDFDPSDDVYKSAGTDNVADAAFVCDMAVTEYIDT